MMIRFIHVRVLCVIFPNKKKKLEAYTETAEFEILSPKMK